MSAMDIIEDSEEQTKCFKCKERLHGTLNIVHKDSERTFVLWNKYQIFLYEDLNFESVAKVFTPEFQINQVIASHNYLVCVDCNGNVHTTSLKFKNAVQKRFKSSFQPREQGILYCIKYSPETTLSLKLQADSYFLCLHKINSEFQVDKEICLTIDEKDWPLQCSGQDKCIISCHTISKEDFNNLSPIFKENVWKNHSLVLISFDKLTVYACILSQKSSDDIICLKKLYTSPAKICDIIIHERESIEILIGLTCGTLVRIILRSHDKPEIIHLNTALSKIIALKQKDSIIYSDGLTMWKAENINSKENISYEQFFVKDVKDFIKYNQQLICTTFTNLIYLLSIENEASYLKQDKNSYCSVEKLLNNSDYLFKINQEIEKNKEIIDRIKEEESHLTVAALSRRQDIMDKFIQQNVVVYKNYEEVLDNSELTFTEEIQEYFKPESILTLVKISASTIQHSLSNILTKVLSNLKIHITLSTEGKILKTTTLKLEEPLKKLQILIPLQTLNITQMTVETEIVSEIPEALDRERNIWTMLHRKNINLTAEHFIKTNSIVTKIKSLKEPKVSLEKMICITAEKQHGELFTFTDLASSSHFQNDLPFYVKLPLKYKSMLKDDISFKDHFHPQKAKYIQKHLTSEDFLKSKSRVFFEIANVKVTLEILKDDFSNPLLKISCGNMKIAFGMRNYFANVFYEDSKLDSEEQFVSNALYTTTENLQKALKECNSPEDCLTLADRLYKNVIAALPL